MLVDISRTGGVLLDRSTQLSVGRMSFLELSAVAAARTLPTIVTADGWLWMISSGYPVEPGETVYLGGFVDSRIEGAQTPVPAGLIKGMWFGANVAPGSGQTFTYTLMKNGAATLCAFTITGSTRKGKSEIEVACADQDEICVRVQVSAGAAAANHNGSVHFAPEA